MLSRLCVREFKTKKQGKVTWVWSTWISLSHRHVHSQEPRHARIPGRNEADSEPLRRVAREVVGKPRARLGIRRQEFSKTIRESVDNDCVGDPNSRTSTPGLVARVGEHTSESGSTRQRITVLSVRSGVLRSIRGQHCGSHAEKPACRRRYRHGASGLPEVSQNVLGRV